MFGVGVEQAPDHTLVLSVMFPRLALKKLNASLTQCDGDFNSFISKDEVFRAREKVMNDLEVSERFVCMLDFRVHRFAYLSASSRLRKSE